jgi:ribosomal protein S18 acetylase RimI-like enzyme
MMAAQTWSAISDYLTSFSEYYPSIDLWCSKVLREVPSGRRSVLALVSAAGTIDGLAITKNGARAKLCHFSIAEHARGDGRGWALMQAAGTEMLCKGARHFHVTTSEEVADEYGGFFTRSGFTKGRYRNGRYRRGFAEWVWSANYDDLVARLFSSGSRCAPRAAPMMLEVHGDIACGPTARISIHPSSASATKHAY